MIKKQNLFEAQDGNSNLESFDYQITDGSHHIIKEYEGLLYPEMHTDVLQEDCKSILFIRNGSGIVEYDKRSINVEKGDRLEIIPDLEYRLVNTSDTQNLEFQIFCVGD